nr:class B sortase [uncultured Lachnoclostridium sp.]
MIRKDKWATRFTLLFGVAFIVSAGMVWRIAAKRQEERAAFRELDECVKVEIAYPIQNASYEQPANDETPSPYTSLKEQNPDFFGWIAIEGTELNYPIMHTPEEPEYYLRRDFEGEKSQSGVPFLSASCYEGCGNYLIYGHNMRNGSMFATLLSYADREYWETHPMIQLDTLSDAGEYTVMGAFYSEAYRKDATNAFRFYQYVDLNVRDIFDEYVEQVLHASLYDTGVRAEYGDQLITLVTCSYHKKNGRFVVVARKQTGERAKHACLLFNK